MTEPFIPTGREFDDGELPTAAKRKSKQEEKTDDRPANTAVHEFVLTVAKQVDDRRGGRRS
ncbi:MAG: hypothetical protein M3445_09670 [Actinomycetota bacterium]|nr:hypothetical protein [Actinomycetota bacterium]